VTVGAVDPHVEPIMVLEDVEANSITAWLRNSLRQIDDQALKDFDWRKQVGKYVVKCKYIVLEYLDQKEVKNEGERLRQLQGDLEKLAREPQFRHLPLPMAIPLADLVVPLDRIQDAKSLLEKADRLIIKTDEREYQVDLSSTKRPSNFVADDLISEPSKGQMKMILLVRKPDYLGDSLWAFRHGKQSIEAHILDTEWLARFRAGREVILPGSAIVGLVDYEYSYNQNGELIDQKHDIIKVLGVEKGGGIQSTLM
jgi:hypothetical protein